MLKGKALKTANRRLKTQMSFSRLFGRLKTALQIGVYWRCNGPYKAFSGMRLMDESAENKSALKRQWRRIERKRKAAFQPPLF